MHPSIELSKQNIELSQRKTSLAKAAFFPSIYVGYFNQRITDATIQEAGLNGFNVGIGIPLWAKPTANRIKIAQMDERIQEVDLSIKTRQLDAELTKLTTEMARLRQRVNYYSQQGLPQVEQLKELAEKQFRGGEASYLEFLQAMNTYLQISKDHLKALSDYHSSSSELNFFINN